MVVTSSMDTDTNHPPEMLMRSANSTSNGVMATGRGPRKDQELWGAMPKVWSAGDLSLTFMVPR